MIVFLLMGFGFYRPVFADNTSAVSQVFQSAKDALDSLIAAKDQGSVNDVALRVNAFNQVLDLSIAEAKDYELKLLTTDKNSDYDVWIKSAINGLTAAIVYYNSEKSVLAGTSPIDLTGIKLMAEDFKNWRSKNYLPLVSEIQDFLLVKQEYSAIDTSQKRLDNITKDLSSLNFNQEDEGTLNGMLGSAKSDIKSAVSLNDQAYQLFLERYVSPLIVSTSSTSTDATSTDGSVNASSSASSSPADATSTGSGEIVSSSTVSTSSTSTVISTDQVSSSTVENGSSTDSNSAGGTLNELSIKDLVGSSLNKIKEAYQNFIDMSNFVRKLLQQ